MTKTQGRTVQEAKDGRAGLQSGSAGHGSNSQVHLRLAPHHVEALRKLARERDQTLSGVVRFLLSYYQSRSKDA